MRSLHFETESILLLGATLVLLVPFVFWWMLGLKRFFPLAVIQIFAGVILGPSLFGAVAPELFTTLFRDQAALRLFPATSINAIALIAVSLFAFNAGAEADLDKIRRAGPSVVSIGVGGLLFTWAFGVFMGLGLVDMFPAIAKDASPFQFALVFGLCNAVPALPILAALLNEMKLSGLRLGQVTLASAGVGDAILWASVAIILPFAPVASGSSGHWVEAALLAFGSGIGTILLVQRVMGPLLLRLKAQGAPERVIMILVGITIFVTASITSICGLHAVMGAFITGVFLPHEVREDAAKKLDMPTALILLPFFFLGTGLKADFNFSNPAIWALFASGLIVCFFGKLIGSVIFARLAGENAQFAVATGVLLQTKGLMELVIVTIFAQKGFLGNETFSALIGVALVSTALTMPVLGFFLRRTEAAVEASGAVAAGGGAGRG